MSSTNLPLPVFFAQTLQSLIPMFDDTLSSSDPSAQYTLITALDNLHLISRLLTSLGVFSQNETVDELGDGELLFMTVVWVIAECEGKGGLGGTSDRMAVLKRSETALNDFLALVSSYSVLSPDEQAQSLAAAADGTLGPKDPAKRREAKIRQYKREREIREQLSTLSRDHPSPPSTPLAFILSLLPPPSTRPAVISTSTASTSVNHDDPPETRQVTLLLLRLLHGLTLPALSSTQMELDLLASAPAPSGPIAPRETREEDSTWRLDRKQGQVKPRQLISGGGRVLQPFTILTSTGGLSDRERLGIEVFRSSHRLPTMTIDEYLEEERRRGNIITGGGQASADAPTESELLALAAEQDGTAAAEEKGEQKRLKEENRARYTELNPRGAGNTMNRG